MALTITQKRSRTHIIENWLNTLNEADREDALEYLTKPDMYPHTALADAISEQLGHLISDRAVIGWRRRNL